MLENVYILAPLVLFEYVQNLVECPQKLFFLKLIAKTSTTLLSIQEFCYLTKLSLMDHVVYCCCQAMWVRQVIGDGQWPSCSLFELALIAVRSNCLHSMQQLNDTHHKLAF